MVDKQQDTGASTSRPGSREPDPQAVPALPGFDPSRVKPWLRVMTGQGEDYIWRGAENALAYFEHVDALLNTPETADFADGVKREAAHQRDRWGSDHDTGKDEPDWFWLIGYLAGKALRASIEGDTEKAKHHTISTAAALANWHLALSGVDNRMRPGIDASGMSAGTAETAQQAQGEARQPDPQGDAQNTAPHHHNTGSPS